MISNNPQQPSEYALISDGAKQHQLEIFWEKKNEE